MNASRTILLRPRAHPKKAGASTGPHKQSQNNFFVASSSSPTGASTPSFARPLSAKAIQLLLGNIGVAHRASMHTIEGMIRERNFGDDIHDDAALDMIDLIARIRSI